MAYTRRGEPYQIKDWLHKASVIEILQHGNLSASKTTGGAISELRLITTQFVPRQSKVVITI